MGVGGGPALTDPGLAGWPRLHAGVSQGPRALADGVECVQRPLGGNSTQSQKEGGRSCPGSQLGQRRKALDCARPPGLLDSEPLFKGGRKELCLGAYRLLRARTPTCLPHPPYTGGEGPGPALGAPLAAAEESRGSRAPEPRLRRS